MCVEHEIAYRACVYHPSTWWLALRVMLARVQGPLAYAHVLMHERKKRVSFGMDPHIWPAPRRLRIRDRLWFWFIASVAAGVLLGTLVNAVLRALGR